MSVEIASKLENNVIVSNLCTVLWAALVLVLLLQLHTLLHQLLVLLVMSVPVSLDCGKPVCLYLRYTGFATATTTIATITIIITTTSAGTINLPPWRYSRSWITRYLAIQPLSVLSNYICIYMDLYVHACVYVHTR